jgi:type II secretory pathway component PulJ
VSLIWLVPAVVGVVAAAALALVTMSAVRTAERLRVTLTRMAELRRPLGRLAEDVQGLGDAVDRLRRR